MSIDNMRIPSLEEKLKEINEIQAKWTQDRFPNGLPTELGSNDMREASRLSEGFRLAREIVRDGRLGVGTTVHWRNPESHEANDEREELEKVESEWHKLFAPLKPADGQEVVITAPVKGFLTPDEITKGWKLAVHHTSEDTMCIQKYTESPNDGLRHGTESEINFGDGDNWMIFHIANLYIRSGDTEYSEMWLS